MIYKILQRKLKIEQQGSPQKQNKKQNKNGDRSGVHKVLAVLVPLVARVLLLFNNTKPT